MGLLLWRGLVAVVGVGSALVSLQHLRWEAGQPLQQQVVVGVGVAPVPVLWTEDHPHPV